MKNPQHIYPLQVPTALWRSWKAKCSRLGQTARYRLTRFMKEDIKSEKEKEE